jgi:hypothetical protein
MEQSTKKQLAILTEKFAKKLAVLLTKDIKSKGKKPAKKKRKKAKKEE